jgi:hypothetical protein
MADVEIGVLENEVEDVDDDSSVQSLPRSSRLDVHEALKISTFFGNSCAGGKAA